MKYEEWERDFGMPSTYTKEEWEKHERGYQALKEYAHEWEKQKQKERDRKLWPWMILYFIILAIIIIAIGE